MGINKSFSKPTRFRAKSPVAPRGPKGPRLSDRPKAKKSSKK